MCGACRCLVSRAVTGRRMDKHAADAGGAGEQNGHGLQRGAMAVCRGRGRRRRQGRAEDGRPGPPSRAARIIARRLAWTAGRRLGASEVAPCRSPALALLTELYLPCHGSCANPTTAHAGTARALRLPYCTDPCCLVGQLGEAPARAGDEIDRKRRNGRRGRGGWMRMSAPPPVPSSGLQRWPSVPTLNTEQFSAQIEQRRSSTRLT
ncbi:hypothetical protein PVAP13_9KG394172 [Panicum virgatum]|uniref:Uncharacterized protein n=1 Tax=Panicum virgatum TaxID=38727 RepID=A0A8T0ND79_PANVG|nr:hypothetical protein PVAP13_9KG394172 [Panicum virgatum]